MKKGSDFVYPDESDIMQLRKGFKLVSNGYLSRGSLLYILGTAQDLHNEANITESLASKAAYLLFEIAAAHPFIDGNKRTAFGTADIFLRLNGYRIKVDAVEGQELIVNIAIGKVDETVVRKWVRQRLKKL